MSLGHRIETVQKEVSSWDQQLIRQAEVLVQNFRFERIALQKKWFDEAARSGRPRGRHTAAAWCPLNLFTRLHNGSLQIYWQLVYRDRVTRAIGYRHLAKTKAGGYDLRQLLGHANDFERDLVTEYEEEAQLQRQRWAQLKSLERHLTLMQIRNDAGGVLFARWKMAATKQAVAKQSEILE